MTKNEKHLDFQPGEGLENAQQVIDLAVQFEEAEVAELVEKLITMGLAEHMFSLEAA